MTSPQHASRHASARHGTHYGHAQRRRNLTPLWIGVVVVLLIAAAYVVLRPQGALPAEVSVAQAHDLYDRGAVFLDVRTQAGWDQGHIARSILVPLDVLPSRLDQLPRDQDIVVVCRSGARSKEGTTVLRRAGFMRVTCMNGGLQAWVAAGYPLTR
jgi:rhodanese-related sulfurtransferase